LPDAVLDRLGTIPKEVRAPGALVLERSAYPVHSLAGIARLEKIRRDVLQRLSLVQAPTLLIQDPFEHHLAIDGLFSLADALENSDISLRIVPGGQHELLLGREYERVIRMVCEFLTGVVEQVAVK
jgi:esterase/lipase